MRPEQDHTQAVVGLDCCGASVPALSSSGGKVHRGQDLRSGNRGAAEGLSGRRMRSRDSSGAPMEWQPRCAARYVAGGLKARD